jgi:hypothetical protein
VLGLAAGLLMIFVAQGVIYRFYELPNMQEYWKQQREQVQQQTGRPADDYLLRRFDVMIANGQTQGFFRSPNTYAAAATLCGLLTVGLGVARWTQTGGPALDRRILAGLLLLPVAG